MPTPHNTLSQQIFEKIRAIVAKKLSIPKEDVNLDFRLFTTEWYDQRKLWSSSGNSRVVHFRSEEAQYYSSRLELAEDDTLDAIEVILNLEEEFDIEITDEVAAQLFTVEQAVNYISQTISEQNNAEPGGEFGC